MTDDCQTPKQSIRLTARQRLILQMIADGHKVEYIAVLLEIKRSTLQWHISRAKRALGAASLPHATAIAARRGLVIVPQTEDTEG
jgi:DNA-binding NarL/FixJ family response regulator